MIVLQDKQDCCGCSACVQLCPKKCIAMQEDEEGFLYPKVDVSLCIDCGLCEKVCPVINKNESRVPLNVYAAINPNEEVRLQSSSGGIFTMLAEQIIEEGGVVFGVGYNEHWEAAHSYTETKEGIAAFRMSKYVQSIVGKTFQQAEVFLKAGRKVLYSGTPCQIAGLKRYLRKNYVNLLTIDFICHGTPSPGVFRWYLADEFAKIARKSDKKNIFSLQAIPSIPKADVLASSCGLEINDIRFRDKKKGWKKFSLALDLSRVTSEGEKKPVMLLDTLDKNPFLRGFLRDLYLRPSCHECPTKELRSGSDITLGDFWGIHNILPNMDDDKGISAILLNTARGKEFFNCLNLQKKYVNFQILCNYNTALLRSSPKLKLRAIFYEQSLNSFFKVIDKLCNIPFNLRIKRAIKIRLGMLKDMLKK